MKKAVLVLNLGTPQAPTPKAVGAYLREFLMDPYVLQTNGFLRFLLVWILIVPLRKFRSAKLYQKIWTAEGSPLFVFTKRLSEKLQCNDYDTEFCFRYGSPSIVETLTHLKNRGTTDLLILPLYPQNAESSNATSQDAVVKAFREVSFHPRVEWVEDFHLDEFYIQSLVDKLRPLKPQEFDHCVFSFHSLPESHLTAFDSRCGDCLQKQLCAHPVAQCYLSQCLETAEAVRERLEIPREKFTVSFQSKLGRQKWLTPSTEQTLLDLPPLGKKRVLLFAPGFICDCLETLEELDFELKNKFLAAGGEEIVRPLCLNNDEVFTNRLSSFIQEKFNR